MAGPDSPKYAVNPETGQVMRNDGTGWAKVKTAKNQQGEILINEGGAWTPLPQKSDPSAPPKGYSEPPKMSRLQAFETMARSGGRVSLADEAEGVKAQFNMVAPGGPLGVFSDVGAGLAGLFMENNVERTGKPLDPRYTKGRDFTRGAQAKAREDRPFTAFAGEALGSAVYPGGALRMGAPIGREALKLGAIGATQGSLFGYAAGEGDTQDRVEGGLMGAVVGGTLGAATPGVAAAALPVVRGARTALANATDAIVEMFGGTGTAGQAYARQVAEAAVRRSMERSGMTPERILETLQRFGNKPAVLAEVIGQDAVNTLSSLTRRPGSTPQAAQDIIAERMGGFPERAADDLRQTTGLTDAQIRGEFGPELAARREAAAPAYTELFEQQGGVTSDRLTQLAGTNTLGPLIRRSQAAAEDLAVTQRRDPASVTPLEVLDLAKRELDDEIATAQRNQQNSELFRLQSLQTALLGELDELTGGQYAAARDLGGEAPRLQEARTQGEQALRPGVTRATVNEQVGALNPQDRAAFASGTASVIDESIAGGRMLPQRFRLPANREKVQAAFGEEAGGEFANRMTAEAELRDLASRWGPRQGSITGTVMESGPSEALDDGIRFATSIARGDRIGFINQAVSWMRRRGYNQQQIDAMGELLLSNPQEGLRRLGIQLPRLPGGGGAAAAGAAAGTPPPPAGAPPPQVPPGSAPAPRTVGVAPATAAPVGAPAPTTPIRTSGIVGNGDLTNAAFGAGLGGIAPAESPEERARNMAIGAGIGGFARRGSQMLDDATRTVGQPRATSGRTVGQGGYFGRQSMRPPGSGPSPREIETQQQWATATPIVTQARTTAQTAQQAADAALQSKAPADIARAKDVKKTLVGQLQEAQASRAGMDTPEDARLADTLASLSENTSDPVLLSTQISAAKTSLDRLLTDIGSPVEGNLIPVKTNILTRTQAPRSAAEGPQDRASVTRYAEGNDDIKPMGFAGPRAKGADLDALQVAQQQVAAGRTPQEVWSETGWYQAKDGKWTFEIDDSAARIANPNGKKLDQFLSHPTLFKNYPSLRGVRVEVNPQKVRPGEAYYDRVGNKMVLGSADIDSAIHEIQHLIQKREGRLQITNPDAFDYQKLKAAGIEGDPAAGVSRRDAAYNRSLSETEARASADRRGMSAEERAATFPEQSYDVAPEDVLGTTRKLIRSPFAALSDVRSAGAGTPKRKYPLAPKSEWYGNANFEQTGGKIQQMTPDEFLAQVRPLEVDDVARDNIDDLKRHMQSGKTLDPLSIDAKGKEDGRHRAIAAKELGIESVPVLRWDSGDLPPIKGMGFGASTPKTPEQAVRFETDKVIAPTDDVQEVILSNFYSGKVVGNKDVPIEQLKGGVMLDDPKEAARVAKLAEKMSGPDGFFSRIIVDENGSVLEGQHRLEAMRQLGAETVPAVVVRDNFDGLDVMSIRDTLAAKTKIRKDQALSVLEQAQEMLAELGSSAAVKREYDFPKGFESSFNEALKLLETGAQPPIKGMGFGASTPQRTVGKPKTSQSARTVGKAKTN